MFIKYSCVLGTTKALVIITITFRVTYAVANIFYSDKETKEI